MDIDPLDCSFRLNVALDICGHIATVAVCNCGILTIVHTGMPCCRHRTRHITPSQYKYTNTEPTCRCAIDVECHTGSHKYPIWCLRSDLIDKSFPTVHTRSERSTIMLLILVAFNEKLGSRCHIRPVANTDPVACESTAASHIKNITPSEWRSGMHICI